MQILELIAFISKMNAPDFTASILIKGDKVTLSAWVGGQEAGYAPDLCIKFNLGDISQDLVDEAKQRIKELREGKHSNKFKECLGKLGLLY